MVDNIKALLAHPGSRHPGSRHPGSRHPGSRHPGVGRDLLLVIEKFFSVFRQDPGFRRDDVTLRRDDVTLRRDDVTFRRDDVTFRRDDVTFRRDDGSRYWLVLLLIVPLLSGCVTYSNGEPVEEREMEAARYNVELGINYLREGEVALAKTKLNRALAQAPRLPDAHFAMGYFLENTGDIKGAEYHYQKAIRLDAKMGEARNNYGVFLCRQQRYLAAEKEFLAAVKDPEYIFVGEAYENAGLCALEANQTDKARHYFEQALAYDTRRLEALYELALLDYQAGDYDRANDYFLRFRELALLSPRELWLGIRLADQLDDRNAKSSYALLLRNTFPDSPEYQWYLEQIN